MTPAGRSAPPPYGPLSRTELSFLCHCACWACCLQVYAVATGCNVVNPGISNYTYKPVSDSP